MKFVIDMNLSPDWGEFLREAGHDAVHWQQIGDADAEDREILERASEDGAVVLTHDLDFGAILAATGRGSPSVVQLRSQETFPERVGAAILDALRKFQSELEGGALVSVDPNRARARLLPIAKPVGETE